LGPELFVIALPGADATAASRAANRISAVIGCTAFAAEPDQKPFVAEFEIAAVELAPGEPIQAAVTRARQARVSGG
jgi:two-component system, cell cycle response regulator PopA